MHSPAGPESSQAPRGETNKESAAAAVPGSTSPPLETLVGLINKSPGLPAFLANIRELLDLQNNPYYTVHDISRVILRDYSLTTQLLKLVNSIYFQTYQRQIHTISSAVLLMGFDTIRDLAVGLRIFENFRNTGSLKQVQHIILHSFLMAIYSQELGRQEQSLKDEEIFLTALLFNLGELVTAYYFPEKFQEIMRLSTEKDMGPSMAAQQVLHVSMGGLGVAILKTWNFPGRLVNRLSTLTSGGKTDSGPEGRLIKIIKGANALAKVVMSPELSSGDLQRQKEKLCRSLGVKPEALENHLSASFSRFREMAQVLKVNLKDLGVGAGPTPAESPVPPASPDSPGAAVPKAAAPSAAPPQAAAPAPGTQDAELQQLRFLYQVMEEINQAIVAKSPISQTLMMIMEGIFRSIGFDRVAFCLVNTQRTRVEGRFGLGSEVESLLPLLRAPLNHNQNAMTQALNERREVLVNPGSKPADRELMDAGFWQASGAKSFLVLPLHVDEKAVGLFYVDFLQAHASITELARHRLRTFRDLTILAIRMSSRSLNAPEIT